MAEKEFNLLHEPWIKVMMLDGSVQEISLTDVFYKAPQIKKLAGELPAQDVAVFRLILAVLYATYATNNAENRTEAIEKWGELWEQGSFEADAIAEYLEEYEERFWLFHPSAPFYQVADIEDAMRGYKESKGKKVKDEEKLKTVARLIGELCQSDNQKRLFPNRTGLQQETLSYNEAARWLLYLNGFDDDSAKMPTPKGVGYLGQLGLVYAEGKNLFETLMLNFVLLYNESWTFDDYKEDAMAYWEKPVESYSENNYIERSIAQPNAQKDLLTLQSRRILLKRKNGVVVGYLLTMGDYIEKDGNWINEQMTLWQKEKNGNSFVPKRHRKERQLWRDFASLISGDEANGRNSGVVEWLRFLQKEKLLTDEHITISIAGVCYKLKGAGWQVVDFVDDSLEMNRQILSSDLKGWVNEIINVLNDTEEMVKLLARFAVKLVDAGGNKGDNLKDAEKKAAYDAVATNAYYKLDQLFRHWLYEIDPGKDDMMDKKVEWKKIAKNLILSEGEDMLAEAGNRTLFGYVNKGGSGNNGFIAFAQFAKALNKLA